MRTSGTESPRADAVRNRDAILDAAVDVLAAEPSATLAEVAAKARLGRATLYRHFESREALLGAIRAEALNRAGRALSRAGIDGCDTREGVRRAVGVLVPLGMRFHILLAEGADNDPDFLAKRAKTLRPLFDLVARGVDNGDFGQRNLGWIIAVLAGLLVTAVRSARDGVITVEEAADLVTTTLFDGLSSHSCAETRH